MTQAGRSAAPRLTLQNPDRAERRGLMAALDAAQSVLWFSPEGRVIDANANAQSLLSYRLESLKMLSYADLVGEADSRKLHLRRHWARIRDGQLVAEERAIMARGGSEIWCSVSYAALRTETGATRRIFALLIDLTPWSWRPKHDPAPGR